MLNFASHIDVEQNKYKINKVKKKTLCILYYKIQ